MKEHEIKLFWDWFYYNEITLRKLREQNSKIQKIFIYWLDRHLHNYCEDLDCIIMFPENPGEKLKLIISANGNSENFHSVIVLTSQAPNLRQWNIIAFIQPSLKIDLMAQGLDKPYVFKDIVLKSSELKFMPLEYENERKIDMVVFFKDFEVHCKNKNLLQVIFIMIQDMIIEKVGYQNINFVELAQMPDQETNQLIYLYDFQMYLDKINKQNRG